MAQRGQAWSVDLVIGVLIFLLVIGVFYALLTDRAENDTTELKVASETIASKLVNDEQQRIVVDSAVDGERLKQLSQKDIKQLKEEFGVNKDFCIFFEDEDGNLVPIIIDEDTNYTGIGSSSINVSGRACSDPGS